MTTEIQLPKLPGDLVVKDLSANSEETTGLNSWSQKIHAKKELSMQQTTSLRVDTPQ